MQQFCSKNSSSAYRTGTILILMLVGICSYGCNLSFSAEGMLEGISTDVNISDKDPRFVVLEVDPAILSLKLSANFTTSHEDYVGEYMGRPNEVLVVREVDSMTDLFYAGGKVSSRHFIDLIGPPWAFEEVGGTRTWENVGARVFEEMDGREKENPIFLSDIDTSRFLEVNPTGPNYIFAYQHDLRAAYKDAIISAVNAVFQYSTAKGDVSSEEALTIRVSLFEDYSREPMLIGSFGISGIAYNHYTYANIGNAFHSACRIEVFDSSDRLIHSFVATGKDDPARMYFGFVDAIEIGVLRSIKGSLEDLSNDIATQLDQWAKSTRNN